MVALKCIKFINQITREKELKLPQYTKDFIAYLKSEAELQRGVDTNASEADILIIVSWNINNTDIDLHVIEPTGEECYYGNDETKIGGKLSIDVTDGYGPEMYVLKRARRGQYKIKLNFYRMNFSKTASKAKAYVEIYQNWGRKNEKLTKKVVDIEKVMDDVNTEAVEVMTLRVR